MMWFKIFCWTPIAVAGLGIYMLLFWFFPIGNCCAGSGRESVKNYLITVAWVHGAALFLAWLVYGAVRVLGGLG